jgi:hypothetical protein
MIDFPMRKSLHGKVIRPPGLAAVLFEHRHRDAGILDLPGVLHWRVDPDLGALRAAARRTYTRTCVAAANCGGAGQDMTAPGRPVGMGKGSFEFCLVAERTRRHPPSDESNYGMGCGGREIGSTETWRG